MKPRRILFVCLGNICRSPAAEGVLRNAVERAGKGGEVEVASAGTIGYHTGNPADQRMRTAALRRGYDLTSRARQVSPRDLTKYDLIVAMDRENYSNLQQMARGTTAKIRMLSDFLDEGWPRDVPDPYYGGPDGFEQVLDMLEAAVPRILSEVTDSDDRLARSE